MNRRPRRTPNYDPQKPRNAKLEGPTAVYRLFSADGELLYVGATVNPENRWAQHAYDKLWWHWVARKEVVWCDSRLEAIQMEADIEYDERPRFCDVDLMGNGTPYQNRKRQCDEQVDRELDDLTATLVRDIDSGRYKDPGATPRPVGPHAKRYNTSKFMFCIALGRAQGEIQARERPVVVPPTPKPTLRPVVFDWLDDPLRTNT